MFSVVGLTFDYNLYAYTNTSWFFFYKSRRFYFSGRTMDFTFDMSQTPLIGRKVMAPPATSAPAADSELLNSNNVHLQRRSTSLSPSDSVVPGWKRPWLCQVITKWPMWNVYDENFKFIFLRRVECETYWSVYWWPVANE